MRHRNSAQLLHLLQLPFDTTSRRLPFLIGQLQIGNPLGGLQHFISHRACGGHLLGHRALPGERADSSRAERCKNLTARQLAHLTEVGHVT